MYTLFRVLLLIWIVVFLVISCVPALTGNAILGAAGLMTGVILFIPWLAGVAILGCLVWFFNPRR